MERALKLLRGLGSCPATPFFEGLPARYITEALRRAGVEHRRDEFGNIVAHVPAAAEASGPPVALVAHMDHPGFEVVEIEGAGAVARAMGGVPAASLTKSVPVFVLAPDGTRIPGLTKPHEDTVDLNDRASDRLVRGAVGRARGFGASPTRSVRSCGLCVGRGHDQDAGGGRSGGVRGDSRGLGAFCG